MRNNLIVLDMDGVVNSNSACRKWINDKYCEIRSRYFDEDEFFIKKTVEEVYATEFVHLQELVFPEYAKRVSSICIETNSDILWSSTWRKLDRYHDINNTRDMFNRRGLPGDRLVGYTPIRSKTGRYFRGDKINEWLLSNPQYTKVAVIDDRDDAGYQLLEYCKFFQTLEEYGLTEDLKIDIINYFKGE